MGIATGKSCGAHGGQVACPSAHGCRVSPPTHAQINETSYYVNNFEATEYTSTLHKGLPTKFMFVHWKLFLSHIAANMQGLQRKGEKIREKESKTWRLWCCSSP